MSQCAPGATISLFMTRDNQSFHSGDWVHAQTFPPKVDMMSLEHHVTMYLWCVAFRWWHFHHNYIRVGGIKGWMHGGRGSQFQDFSCRAYRDELIPSRVLWCVPTSGQPGVLYLITTKMCLVFCLILIIVFLQSEPYFYWIWLLEWQSSQLAQLKRPDNLVTRTAILYQSQWRLEEERSGSSWSPTLFYSEVVTNLWHPLVGLTKVSKWQLECYNQEGL